MNEQKLQSTLKFMLSFIATVYLLASAALFINRSSSKAILDDAWHMQYYTQFAQGGHCYYPAEDLERTYDGYTPLASQLFGWGLRFIDNDVRVVRVIAGLFGFGAMCLIGLITFKLTSSRWLAFVATGLSSILDPVWFMDVGPNTIHVFFALLGLWFLVRDPALSAKTIFASTASFFLCYWTKQTGIAYMTAALFYCLLKSPKKSLLAGAVMALVFVATIYWYETKPDSRFIYLVFKWNQNQPVIWSRLWEQLLPLFTGRFGILLALSAGGLLALRSWKNLFNSPHFLLLGASAVTGLISACKYGSGLSQTWVLICMLIICGCTAFSALLKTSGIPHIFIYALLLTQTLALVQDIRPAWIRAEDNTRYNQIMEVLKTPNKKTYYINSGYLNQILGQKTYANAGHDCWWKKTYRRDLYPKTWAQFLKTNPWDIVIIDIPLEDGSFLLYETLNRSYRAVAEIPADSRFPQSNRLRFKKIVFEKKISSAAQ
jgi:hypothetical protein